MKFLMLIAFVVGAVTAATLPDKEQQFVNQVHAQCQSNTATRVDEELLKHLGDHKDDTQVGIHMLCMSKGAGLQKQDGDIAKKVVEDKVSLVIDDETQVNTIVNKCAVMKGTPEKTAVFLWMCMYQNKVPYVPILN